MCCMNMVIESCSVITSTNTVRTLESRLASLSHRCINGICILRGSHSSCNWSMPKTQKCFKIQNSRIIAHSAEECVKIHSTSFIQNTREGCIMIQAREGIFFKKTCKCVSGSTRGQQGAAKKIHTNTMQQKAREHQNGYIKYNLKSTYHKQNSGNNGRSGSEREIVVVEEQW